MSSFKALFEAFLALLGQQDTIDWALEWNAVAMRVNILDHNGPVPWEGGGGGGGRELYIYDAATNPANTGLGCPQCTQGPPASAHALEMIHRAMFEAYNRIEGLYTPYYPDIEFNCSPEASIKVAVAQAAHDCMVGVSGMPGLYIHDQSILDYVAESLAKTKARELNPLALSLGETCGHEVGLYILKERDDDGWSIRHSYLTQCTYTPSFDKVGDHRQDKLNPNQGYLSPCAGEMRPFTMSKEDLEHYKAGTPPGMDDQGNLNVNDHEYLEAVKQVYELGKDRGGTGIDDPFPLDDKTYIVANAWSANASPGTGTPLCMYNDIARKIAIEQGNTPDENMLMFAQLHSAMADTAISTWDSKFSYRLWRPIWAIQDHPVGAAAAPGEETSEVVLPDPNWTPLGASRSNRHPGDIHNFSPPFPGHTSGHAAFGCAALQTVANFYGTYNIPFTYTSVEWNGETRDQYGRVRPCVSLSHDDIQAAQAQNAASRVMNGVHFAFEGTMGCKSGVDIANHVFEQMHLPIGGEARTALSFSEEEIEAKVDDALANTPTSGYEADMCEGTPPYPYVSDDLR